MIGAPRCLKSAPRGVTSSAQPARGLATAQQQQRRRCRGSRNARRMGPAPVAAVALPEQAAPKQRNLKQYTAAEMTPEEVKACVARPRVDFSSILGTVQPIVDSVRDEGDAAVARWTAKFDGVQLDSVCVPIDSLPEPQLDAETRAAFDTAFDNISAFHAAQKAAPVEVETMPGVRCSRVTRPIEAVGLYVPGGTAVLPSSTLMLAVPAGLAGCRTIVMATPPRPDGSITPEVLYCARKAGVTHVLKAGGAQAVAAMAWGTETCPKVHKILGPGNQFVTAAKMTLQNSEAMVAMDMPAGPSEVLVIADASASPAHVAADLLSQAEHGKDSQVILVALPGLSADAVEAALEQQLAELPRLEAVRSAFNHSAIVHAKDRAEATAFSNIYAPEHLIINTEAAEEWVADITSAGSVFLGPWAPVTVGDYASGTNHTLPTYGYAKMYSGVSLDSFQKHMTVQALTREGLANIGPAVQRMAAVEGLEAHRKSVSLRLEGSQ